MKKSNTQLAYTQHRKIIPPLGDTRLFVRPGLCLWAIVISGFIPGQGIYDQLNNEEIGMT